jgi:hypothetical protein
MNKFALILKSIPLGTLTIIIVSLITFIFNIMFSWSLTEIFCLKPGSWSIWAIFGNQFITTGYYYTVISITLFPFTASNIEASIGTFQFLYLFFMSNILISILYYIAVWMCSFIFDV